MLIGWIYFFVIIIANTVGAISGMGGGVIIKPVFDAIGAHPLIAISFYSSVAVFTMAFVSTWRQLKKGVSLDIKFALILSFGSIIGGVLGNTTFEFLLEILNDQSKVQWIQIILTIISLLFPLLYTRFNFPALNLTKLLWYFVIGLFLGFLSTLLGIGGGPINVALLMWCFAVPIKEATVYSIVTIFFSQLSKLITIGVTTGFLQFDLSVLPYIIGGAIIGGLLGAQLSGVLSENAVLTTYQIVILIVIVINIYNGFNLLT